MHPPLVPASAFSENQETLIAPAIEELLILSNLTSSCQPLLLNSVRIAIRTKIRLAVYEHTMYVH